jgi:hypothetical protein
MGVDEAFMSASPLPSSHSAFTIETRLVFSWEQDAYGITQAFVA